MECNEEMFLRLFEIKDKNNTEKSKDPENLPFADSTNFLKDVVNFISIELLDKTRVYEWFSPNATLLDLFQFVSSKLEKSNVSITKRGASTNYSFYLQDKEVKNDSKNIRFTTENQSKILRDCLSPINPGSTRNRYSLKVVLN